MSEKEQYVTEIDDSFNKTQSMHRQKVPFKERISYGLGDTAGNLIFMMSSTYLMYFYTDISGLDASAIGTLFLIARFMDAIGDPIVGICIDRTNTRWGRSRPYFLWFCAPFALFAVLTFYVPDLSTTLKLVYVYITYLLLNIGYSLVTLPLSSLLPNLTSDTKERTVLNSFRMIGGQVGAFLTNLTALPLVYFLGRGNDQKGFLMTIVFFALIGVAMYLLTFKNTRERVRTVHNEKINIKQGFRALKSNLPWWIILFIYFTYWFAFTVKNQTAIYYMKYNLGHSSLTPIITGLTVMMILSMIMVPFIANRIGKRNTMLIGFAIAIIAQLMTYVSTFTASTSILIGSTALGYLGLGLVNGLIVAAIADVVDYGEWKTGIRAPGFLASAESFGVKFGTGLGGASAAWIMSSNGYIAHKVQSSQSLHAIQFDFIWIPLIMFVLGFISLLFLQN
ncbi:MFS transporter [Virgibacillus halophilus]|uniref:MFS transporter n=1 Tax=Tigheibacillus halophilus TaxID=361280 RepID=A0ABU5C5F8_9BACI|nr:MFS transporter [Virgibacillus halophilus]